LDEAQNNLLDTNTIVFAYSIGNDNAYGFAISKYKIKIFSLPARKEIQKKISDYIKILTEKETPDYNLAKDLYNLLLKPGFYTGFKKLIIIPDDVLYYLPFETLISSNDNWLINNLSISYSPSISALREIIGRSNIPIRDRSIDLVAFGDPEYQTYSDLLLPSNYELKRIK
jgi:CHAT domain-containing protein